MLALLCQNSIGLPQFEGFNECLVDSVVEHLPERYIARNIRPILVCSLGNICQLQYGGLTYCHHLCCYS